MQLSYRILSGVALICLLGCQQKKNSPSPLDLYNITDQFKNYYDLASPQEKYFLPYVLAEISGLSYLDNSVLTVDDETGRIFIYDFEEKDITHSIAFGKPGDYEGVELVGDTVYVLRSDGDLFKFPYTSEKKIVPEKIETELKKKNDTEGIAYSPQKNHLLIACKESPKIQDEDDIEGRAIYSYTMNHDKLSTDPIYTISRDDVYNFWTENRDFTYEKNRIKFKPSGIAVHPIDKHIYVLASVGKLLVILDPQGEIIGTYPISSRLLNQPEGICFSPEGDLYISSEGEGDRGYILKFDMKSK